MEMDMELESPVKKKPFRIDPYHLYIFRSAVPYLNSPVLVGQALHAVSILMNTPKPDGYRPERNLFGPPLDPRHIRLFTQIYPYLLKPHALNSVLPQTLSFDVDQTIIRAFGNNDTRHIKTLESSSTTRQTNNGDNHHQNDKGIENPKELGSVLRNYLLNQDGNGNELSASSSNDTNLNNNVHEITNGHHNGNEETNNDFHHNEDFLNKNDIWHPPDKHHTKSKITWTFTSTNQDEAPVNEHNAIDLSKISNEVNFNENSAYVPVDFNWKLNQRIDGVNYKYIGQPESSNEAPDTLTIDIPSADEIKRNDNAHEVNGVNGCNREGTMQVTISNNKRKVNKTNNNEITVDTDSALNLSKRNYSALTNDRTPSPTNLDKNLKNGEKKHKVEEPSNVPVDLPNHVPITSCAENQKAIDSPQPPLIHIAKKLKEQLLNHANLTNGTSNVGANDQKPAINNNGDNYNRSNEMTQSNTNENHNHLSNGSLIVNGNDRKPPTNTGNTNNYGSNSDNYLHSNGMTQPNINGSDRPYSNGLPNVNGNGFNDFATYNYQENINGGNGDTYHHSNGMIQPPLNVNPFNSEGNMAYVEIRGKIAKMTLSSYSNGHECISYYSDGTSAPFKSIDETIVTNRHNSVNLVMQAEPGFGFLPNALQYVLYEPLAVNAMDLDAQYDPETGNPQYAILVVVNGVNLCGIARIAGCI